MSLNERPFRQVQTSGFSLLICREFNNKCVGISLRSSKFFGKMYKRWGDFLFTPLRKVCLPLRRFSWRSSVSDRFMWKTDVSNLAHYYYYYYYYYWYSALGPVWAETNVQSGDWHGFGTLHPGQVLRGSLPLISPLTFTFTKLINFFSRTFLYFILGLRIKCQ